MFVPPPLGMHPSQVRHWQQHQHQQTLRLYHQQQTDARTQEAQAARQQMQGSPQPLLARNMFNIKDLSNMFSLMEPMLLCVLHQEMFNAGELRKLEWHWDFKKVRLSM